jgi:ParB family chromosome partitioning protein
MTESPFIRMIPLTKLVLSKANIRKTAREAEIEELAASIAAHGLLQNLTVRPILDADGKETGKFEVVAGGRRLMALKLLAKRKVITKNHPVPCALLGDLAGEEVSLAENIFQCPMHPADQYEAFAKLHADKRMAVEDIAARFGVAPTVVKQRLKLAAVSPTLMQIYRDGEISLEQLMAFTLTDDHAIQERVWMSLSYNKSRDMIRRLLTEGQVPASDRRPKFIGISAYEAADGVIIRDLFGDESAGFFDDPALLGRLVLEKLEQVAEAVSVEGWKWVTMTAEFNYAFTADLRRIHPEPVVFSDEQQPQIEALEADYEALSIRHEGEDVSAEIEAEFQHLEAEIAALRGHEQFRPEDISISGAFVSLGFDGEVRIERGFVRSEDEPVNEGSGASATSTEYGNGRFHEGTASNDEDDEPDGTGPLSDRLMTELTAYRTAGLRDALAQNPEIAPAALLHTLALGGFHGQGSHTCLEIEARHTSLERHAPGIAESQADRSITKRHKDWAKRLPKDAADLWPHILRLDPAQRLDLLAHCVSLSVNAVSLPWERRSGLVKATDCVAEAVGLDMTIYWQPTVANYFSRVRKAQILTAVREAVSEEAANRLMQLKKQPMAEAAEQLIGETGWLPSCLRSGPLDLAGVAAENASEVSVAA